MANKVLLTEMDDTPPQICFADHAGDFAPTAADDLRKGADVEVQLSLATVADSTYRQSTKADLDSNRAPSYAVRAALEFVSAPTAGDAVYFYWAPSSSSTPGTGNSAGVTGADSAWDGDATNADAAVKQLQLIGVFVCTAYTGTQVAECGVFTPTERYGTLVVRNESNVAFFGDDVECHIVFDPIVPEVQ